MVVLARVALLPPTPHAPAALVRPAVAVRARGFQAMVERAGVATGFDMKIHPHMLRHACGFKLANDGVDTRTIQAYLGHKSIQHTVRYTELAPNSVQELVSRPTAPCFGFEIKKGDPSFSSFKIVKYLRH